MLRAPGDIAAPPGDVIAAVGDITALHGDINALHGDINALHGDICTESLPKCMRQGGIVVAWLIIEPSNEHIYKANMRGQISDQPGIFSFSHPNPSLICVPIST